MLYDQVTANKNLQNFKKKTGRKNKSPYEIHNFFNRRTRFNKTDLQNIVDLHHSQGELPRSVHKRIISENKLQTKYIKERLVQKNDDS
jgi:hypothetical protein